MFGQIAGTIAQKVREAKAAVAEAERAQAEAQQRAILRASGVVVAAVPPGTSAPSVGSLARRAAAEQSALDELFSASKPPEVPLAKSGHPTLLAAFVGGAPLLSAIILSEALAAPVALREPRW